MTVPWEPQFKAAGPGRWFVLNIRWPDGNCGCVRRGEDHSWRIERDPAAHPHPTRAAGARAERDLAAAAAAAQPGWQRIDDAHPRWEIKNARGDGRNFLITDMTIRTFGRKHTEQVVLVGLPPLPEDAWTVIS